MLREYVVRRLELQYNNIYIQRMALSKWQQTLPSDVTAPSGPAYGDQGFNFLSHFLSVSQR